MEAANGAVVKVDEPPAPVAAAQAVEAPALPEVVEEADALKLEKLDLMGENLQLKWLQFTRDADAQIQILRTKYGLGPADSWDLPARRVQRVAK